MANNYNFVKFLRGSQAAYNQLAKPDINTLYFIYDEADSNIGKLYLGSYLINTSSIDAIALQDLNDIDIGALTGGEILQYNKTLRKWQPILINDLINSLNRQSNTAVMNSNIIKQDNETDIEAIERQVSNANDGDFAIVDGTVYIYANGVWSSIVNSVVINLDALTDKINNIENTFNNIYTKLETDNAIATAITQTGYLTYTTVGNLDNINPAAVDSQNKIFLVQKTIGTLNNNYDEFIAVNGTWEKIGNLEVDLSNYVSNTTVGDLNNLIHRSFANSTIVDELNTLADQLTWKPIENS